MKFGKKYEEAQASGSTGGSSGKWIKGFKEGETRIRFLQELKDAVVYYEHYNPAGTAFPCTGDRDSCPGCTSTNERMKSASRKVALNALVGQYVDVYKLPVKLTNRLQIRSDRNGGTITDRDYLITRVGKSTDTEYDLESGNAAPVDLASYELIDIEGLLAESFKENWPDFDLDTTGETRSQERPVVEEKAPFERSSQSSRAEATTGTTAKSLDEGVFEGEMPPPSEPAATSAQQSNGQQEEVEITLDQLKTMTPDQLRTLCAENGAPVPEELHTQAEIIGWMAQQFA